MKNRRAAFLDWWKNNWGFGIFAVDVFAALASLWMRVSGHYIAYTEPARYLWNHQDPYGITFAGTPGTMLYSPGCTLFFFGPFTLFPQLLGQFLYMSLSAAVIFWGVVRLSQALLHHFKWDLNQSYYRHLFWLMCGSEVLGGIIATKIDVFIVGAILWAVANMLENRRPILTLFVMGIATSWKLHPLPLFGLVLLVYVLQKRWREPLSFAVGLAAGFLSPLLVLTPAENWKITQHWMGVLEEYIGHAWLYPIFQHLYGFYFRTFGLAVDLHFANRITMVAGLFFAATVATVFWKSARKQKEQALLAALGLGSAYTALFSHLVQSNSYAVYLPLPLVFIFFAAQKGWDEKRTSFLLFICFWIISLAYSDFTPRPLYRTLFAWGIKPIGVLILTLGLLSTIYGKPLIILRKKTLQRG